MTAGSILAKYSFTLEENKFSIDIMDAEKENVRKFLSAVETVNFMLERELKWDIFLVEHTAHSSLRSSQDGGICHASG